jgi:CAAX prenyl protease-like protein
VPRFVDAKDKEWHELPIGRFTLASFAVTVGLFGVAHHRWAVAIAFCAILNLYLMWRRSLGPAIVVHAVTNLALAIYVLHTGQWSFW